MIASPEKLADMHARKECLDLMEECLRMCAKTKDQTYYDLALDFGTLSKEWERRLKGDYSEKDKKWVLYHKLHI